MVKFLARRVIFLIATLLFVSVVVFAVVQIAPGNVAVNTLGNTITPEQEASFNAQNGLDQAPLTRYRRWMIGSDWEAANLIGDTVVPLVDSEDNTNVTWWAVDDQGNYYQNRTAVDGETMLKLIRQEDGTVVEQELSDDVWSPNESGDLAFWGINQSGQAAMWVKGATSEAQVLTKAGWTTVPGAPIAYIPLQRGLLRGDAGISFKDRKPVAPILFERLQNTLFLAGTAFIIVMPLALALGFIAGLNEGSFVDRFLSISSLIATATPEFASGVFLILIFANWLGWFPGAVVMTNENALFQNPEMLVLPILTLTLIELGYVLRITRSSMVEVMRTNYIRTAVLKGLPRGRIVLKHALRNALMAPITIITLHINWLIGGIVVVEVLFGFPGMGRYILDAALFKDIFAIGAAAMVMVIVAVISQLIADIIYTYLNPRIRYS